MSKTQDKKDETPTISEIEKEILSAAIAKLNGIARVGRGDSLTEDETLLFIYWKNRGNVRAIENGPFGEIYELRI